MSAIEKCILKIQITINDFTETQTGINQPNGIEINPTHKLSFQRSIRRAGTDKLQKKFVVL